MTDLGRFLVAAGFVAVAVGLLLLAGSRLPEWLRPGHLPGDIVVRRGSATFYAPVVTCLVLSLLLSIVVRLLNRN